MSEVAAKDVFLLIKSALTGQRFELSENFDFSEAAKLSRKHQIENIIYYGTVNCGIPTSNPYMRKLFDFVCAGLYRSEIQAVESARIFAAFEAEKIDYMPLKGTLLKELYPKSDMRCMSDVDVLIKVSQYPKIREIMTSLGYSEKTESDHELIWTSSSMLLELHKRIVPSYNQDFYAYFGDGWQLAHKVEGTKSRYKMTGEDEYIYLFTHFAKHYRDGGIGIKHMIDFHVFFNANRGLNRQYIEKQLDALGLLAFEKNIRKTLSVWFDDEPATAMTELITAVIFDSGTFGTKNAHLLAAATKKTKSLGSSKKARLSEYMYLIFLPYDGMCEKYPVLERAKILLPFFWIYRLAEAVVKKRKKIKSHREDINLTSDENVSEYGKMLNAVGLDFRFGEKTDSEDGETA